MPYYDFRCSDCQEKSRQFFSFEAYDTAEPVCPACQSSNLQRIIGRVAVAQSEASHSDNMLDDSMMSALENDDPRALGRMMRKMSAESGEPLDDEFGEVVDRLEKGQSPEAIEKAMPDLSADSADAGGL